MEIECNRCTLALLISQSCQPPPEMLTSSLALHYLHSLLSIVAMCNAGCTVTFTKIGCTIVYRGRTIICGHKCMRTGLWMVPLQQGHTKPSTHPATTSPATTAMAANVEATSSAAKYARYIHQLLCYPPASTLL
jgi:hypothetical protein